MTELTEVTPASSLAAFDDLLAQMAGTPGGVDVRLPEVAAAILDGCEANVQRLESPVGTLFAPHLGAQTRRRIAICLLHLLNVNPEFLEQDVEIAVDVLKLFDDTLEHDIYATLGLSLEQQNYQKQRALTDIIPTTEADLLSAIQTPVSMDNISVYESILSREFSNPICQALFTPFTTRSLLSDRLHELFRYIRTYGDSSSQSALTTYQQAREVLVQYKADAVALNTRFNTKYLVYISTTLTELIDVDFASNPVAQPASLDISTAPKNYPLHQIGYPFSVSLVLNNMSPGQAYDVTLTLDTSPDIQATLEEFYLGQVGPGLRTIDVPCEVMAASGAIDLIAEVTWTNFDGTQREVMADLQLQPQRTDIQWDDAVLMDAYDLEPVVTESRMIGRQDQLDRLTRMCSGTTVSSTFIRGQRRVGKTSVAKVLKERLLRSDDDWVIVDLQAGDYRHHNPSTTVNDLGLAACQQIRAHGSQYAGLEIPIFDQALAPLSGFIDSVLAVNPSVRLLIILDEIDELPIELLLRSNVGDTFFLTLRAIANKQRCGFVLIGGEGVARILDQHGQQVNKFAVLDVDYFPVETLLSDYQELVRFPVADTLEYSDDAVSEIFQNTHGNPYYTNMLCRIILDRAIKLRDSMVTKTEVIEAIEIGMPGIYSNSFAHFWDDGIIAPNIDRDIQARARKLVLLAISDIHRNNTLTSADLIVERAGRLGASEHEATTTISEFLARGIFSDTDGVLSVRIPLFRRWLIEKGPSELLTDLIDPGAVRAVRIEEDELYVKAVELTSLARRWGTYRGSRVTGEDIRSWLDQFPTLSDRRLMFTLLQGMNFFSEETVREKLRTTHGEVIRGTSRELVEGQRVRRDVLVSHLDSVGKSGPMFARWYAKENNIFVNNVVDRDRVAERLATGDIGTLIFVNDLIGTGRSSIETLAEIAPSIDDLIVKDGVAVRLVVLASTPNGQKAVERKLATYDWDTRLVVAEEILSPFDGDSVVFDGDEARIGARELTESYGRDLDRRRPLGYGGFGLTVAFPDNCPNNSIPILWRRSHSWEPLFARD